MCLWPCRCCCVIYCNVNLAIAVKTVVCTYLPDCLLTLLTLVLLRYGIHVSWGHCPPPEFRIDRHCGNCPSDIVVKMIFVFRHFMLHGHIHKPLFSFSLASCAYKLKRIFATVNSERCFDNWLLTFGFHIVSGFMHGFSYCYIHGLCR